MEIILADYNKFIDRLCDWALPQLHPKLLRSFHEKTTVAGAYIEGRGTKSGKPLIVLFNYRNELCSIIGSIVHEWLHHLMTIYEDETTSAYFDVLDICLMKGQTFMADVGFNLKSLVFMSMENGVIPEIWIGKKERIK